MWKLQLSISQIHWYPYRRRRMWNLQVGYKYLLRVDSKVSELLLKSLRCHTWESKSWYKMKVCEITMKRTFVDETLCHWAIIKDFEKGHYLRKAKALAATRMLPFADEGSWIKMHGETIDQWANHTVSRARPHTRYMKVYGLLRAKMGNY